VEGAAHADRRGARVVWGSCWEGEGAPAFWPWIQALRAYASDVDDETLGSTVGPGAGDILRLLPELEARLPAAVPAPELEPEQARFRLFDAVASTLCRAASRRPLLIVLDDLHWGDESSLRLLGFVAAQLPTAAVAVVGTYRDTEVGAGHPLATMLHDAAQRAHVLPLTGLDADAVSRIMAATAGTTLHPELAADVHRQTGGNPLFVGEITRLLDANNALDRTEVSVGVPAGVREVIERRMARLPQRCIELLTLAAVIGEEFTIDVVADAAAAPVTEVVEQLEAAVEGRAARPAGVGRYRFAHALFREALYDGQGTIAKARLHLRVATALESRARSDVSAAELANHFAEGALTGEGAKAVHYARLAGAEATIALAYNEAIAQYERALAVLDLVGGSDGDRGEVLLDLAAARFRAGDRAGARTEIDRAVDIARKSGRGDVLAEAALTLTKLGGVSGLADNERVALLEEAREVLGNEESALRARVLAGLAKELYHTWLHRDESDNASVLAAEAVDLARRVGDRQTLAAALLALHDVQWLSGKEHERLTVATELAQTARLAGDRELATEAVLLQAVAYLELSDARAVTHLEEFVRQAELLHQPHFDYLVATRRATLAMIEGDVAAIDRHLDEARQLADVHEEPDAKLVEGAQVIARDQLAGTWQSSVEQVKRAYSGRAYDELNVVMFALVAIESGDTDRARVLLSSVDLDEIEVRYVRNYGWVYTLALLAEAASQVGDAVLIGEIERRLREHTGRCIVIAGCVSFFGSVDHYLGLLYAATGRPDEARKAFELALTAYDRLGAVGWAARTHRALEAIKGSTEPAAELHREGPVWTVRYGGAEARVKDVKGMRDLAVLLSSPGSAVPAAELMAQGLAIETGADAVLDAEAKARFRGRLAELESDLADAERDNDLGRIGQLQAEREAVAHELAAALGLGGRSRTLGDPAERARKAVSSRIRDAMQRVAAAHPELGRHLETSVRTGTFCSYAPVTPTRWRVTDDTARQS